MQYKDESATQSKPLDNEEEAENEVLNFDEGEKFIPLGNCEYRQQGPYLICYSCQLQHAVYVGMEKMMVGVDGEGKPILKDR